ncbi:MAG: hypothetical protein FWC43_05515 [Planctomycetaceae bacterium]|nr:hypothetical protein [Planctomycetaceae bacterium]
MKIQEIGGSPKELYDRNGFSAERVFLVPWEKRQEFTELVLASPEVLTYPGQAQTAAVRLKMEPLEPDAIELNSVQNIATDLPGYGGSFLKSTVYYESVSDNDRDDLPVTPSGSWITYRMEIGATEELLLLTGWKWSDLPGQALPSDFSGVKRIPYTEHHVTWNQVVGPPWTAILQLQGKVNQVAFLGCEPGTLLFDGAVAYKLYRKNDTINDTPSSFTWQIRYVFRERSIKSGGQVYGWNHFYRPSPPGWVELVNGSQKFYDSGDFNELFVPEGNGN